MALPHWLTECIQAPVDGQRSIDAKNVLEFPRGPRNDGQSALDLVYQAAEVVSELEDHARERKPAHKDFVGTRLKNCVSLKGALNLPRAACIWLNRVFLPSKRSCPQQICVRKKPKREHAN